MNQRISSESLDIKTLINDFSKLNFEVSSYFVDHYKVNITIVVQLFFGKLIKIILQNSTLDLN